MDDPVLPLLRDAQHLLLTMDEAAQRLGITWRVLEGLTARGRLTKLRFKGHTYLASYEVDLYLFHSAWMSIGSASMKPFRRLRFH